MLLGRIRELWDETLGSLRRHWPLWLATAVGAGIVSFAITLSDEQGRMALPRAYSVKMTCEDDIEAYLWRGGCDRIAADIAKSAAPSFGELYDAFVLVHHRPTPGEAAAALGDAPDPAFNLAAILKGQRYGLALSAQEFADVKSKRQADTVMEGIDARDRALLVIGRAGLGYDALAAGALANLVHPVALVDGARQYLAILMGTSKRSDFSPHSSTR
jgi:hypothetical protein